MRSALLLVSLLGCTPPPTPVVDDGEDSAPEGEITISQLDPDFGPVDGGTNVTIYGEGFEGNVRVWFDGTELTVSVFDSRTLIITTPAVSTSTDVDVRVESDLGEATLVDGFSYGDGGGGGDGVSGVVQYELTQIACPECWNLTTALTVNATAAFHAPVTGSWTNWLPPSGTCAINPGNTPPTSTTTSVGTWVYMTSGSTSVAMRETTGSTGSQYASNGLSEADYPRNATFDLSAPDVGLTADAVLRTPQSITSLTPSQMLLVDMNEAFQPVVSWSGQTFTWSPSGGSDPFIILIEGYSGTDGTFLGTLLCVGPDNGSMAVPGSYLQQFPSNSLLGVGMHRYAIGSTTASDGTTIESVSQFGVLGTASFF
ncbi:MAG: IPT/TIG domain-containing protein [Proteobacteria bacterium]|nr:IPT/TIG domain-containing protein [Pseudomonadota bacterium]